MILRLIDPGHRSDGYSHVRSRPDVAQCKDEYGPNRAPRIDRLRPARSAVLSWASPSE